MLVLKSEKNILSHKINEVKHKTSLPLKQMPLFLCNHEIEKEQLLLALILMCRLASIKNYRKKHALIIIRNH